MRRDLLILFLVVLALRLPFLFQPVQGDDVYYLLIARNAQVDPLHPMQFGFRLQGETVWAAGHTRPPLTGWFLGGLLALVGQVNEPLFHLAYLLLSLVTVAAVYALARRFTAAPLAATLLFVATPAFLVNGTKLEADLPLVAFWTVGFACFVAGRFGWAAAALAGAGLCAYQSVFAIPILAHRAWFHHRRRGAAWLALLAPAAALAAYQLFERLTVGTAPAMVLAGYFASYDLLALERKLRSALALLAHLGWVVSPLAALWAWRRPVALSGACTGAGVLLAATLAGYSPAERALYAFSAALGLAALAQAARFVWRRRESDEAFLAAWALVFFAGALAAFYAGSARYLLPLAPALALLVARQVPSPRRLLLAAALHAPLGLTLAWSEYEVARQYRDFARELEPFAAGRRLWTNAEWGLRFYLGELGGEPLLEGQQIPAGAVVAESRLAAAVPYRSEGMRRALLEADIGTGGAPVRTIGPGSHAGYSSSEFGVLPFGLGGGVVDRVAAYAVGLGEPTLSYISLEDPAADEHLLSGFYPSDGAAWRWSAPQAAALLRRPAGTTSFELDFHVPQDAPTERVRIEIDGQEVADEQVEAGGRQIRAPLEVAPAGEARVTIEAEPPYQPPGDDRELGVVVLGFGFR